MNGAWIAVALLGAFGVFSWAENKSQTAVADPTASTTNLLNSIASLLKGTSSTAGKSSGGSSSGGSSGGSGGGAGSGSSAGSASSSYNDAAGDYNSDAVDMAEQGLNPDGSDITFAPTDTDSTGLISDEPAPVYVTPSMDYTPPDDSDDSDDFEDDSDDWD